MALPRNIQVLNPISNPPAVLAGFYQHGSVSIANFHSWLTMLLVVDGQWRLFPANSQGQYEGEPALGTDDIRPLRPGTYVVLSPGGQALEVSLTDENYRPRTISLDVTRTPQSKNFKDRVRERDGRCCITRRMVDTATYTGFRASHIFPTAHCDVWDLRQLSYCIEDDGPAKAQGPNSINSVQNGLLLRSDVHDRFDSYLFAINPDDDYRIIDFSEGGRYDGQQLWINQAVEPKYRPSRHLLQEHLKQCILANVKGAGRDSDEFMDPEEEFDLTDFSRWGKPIVEGQPSRLELEVRSRLCDHTLPV